MMACKVWRTWLGKGVRFLAVVGLMAGWAVPAQALPIVYQGTLAPGVPVTGDVLPDSIDDADTSDYWRFFGTAGQTVTITGRRLEGDHDPAFYLFAGLFADTDDVNFAVSLASGDDELPPALPGPFGDPRVIITLPVTGDYTVVFQDFLSGPDTGDDGLFKYQLVLTVPEPGTLVLVATGLIGVLGLAWCRRARSLN